MRHHYSARRPVLAGTRAQLGDRYGSGSFLGVGFHCFPPPLAVPTFASRCLHVQATWETSISERRKYGREMAGQFCLWFRLPHKSRGSLTCRSNLRHGDGFTSPTRKACCGFFCPKNPTASARIEPAILGTSGQHANHRSHWKIRMQYVGLGTCAKKRARVCDRERYSNIYPSLLLIVNA